MSSYILVLRRPDKEIVSRVTRYVDPFAASLAASLTLHSDVCIPKDQAQRFGEELARQPVGTIWGHPSGYDFRILEADLTSDGYAITPGLPVYINDNWEGAVLPGQFFADGLTDPGGKFFDGWYLVCKGTTRMPYAKYNGERMRLV